jgi:uncharacterized membrane protein YGL010W
MTELTRYFEDYEGAHRTQGNEVCHFLGIPMILVTLLGLLAQIVLVGNSEALLRVDAGVLLWLFGTGFYLRVGWRLGAPFSLVVLGAYFWGRALSTPVLWSFFALGWIFQGVGHAVFEKSSPAFFRNLQHILVGPIWIFARALKIR